MQEILKSVNVEENVPSDVSRRTLLGGMIASGLGLAVLRLMPSAEAAMTPKQPEAETGREYPMATPNAKTEKQFRMGVIGPAMLSLMASEIAVDKAANAETKEFANFELREAIAVTTVLKSLGTPVPPMNAMAKATLAKLKSTSKGADFDKAYIKAQLGNHEFLRDLAESYLTNSAGQKSMPEMHGRHLATLSLSTFKEHVVHCKNITKML